MTAPREWVEVERVSHRDLARMGTSAAKAKIREWEARARTESLRILQDAERRFVILERLQ